MILIQHITSSWSKASRGGPSARRRNAVPEALPLPPVAAGGRRGELILHTASYGEGEDFASPAYQSLSAEGAGGVRVGCVRVVPLEGGARVAFEYDPGLAGMPQRASYPGKSSFELGPGGWARVRYNGRFSSDEGGWWYQKTVVNVGCFDEVREDVFLSAPPLHTIDQMAPLW